MSLFRRKMNRWQIYVLAHGILLNLGFLAFLVATFVDSVFRLGWGYTWSDVSMTLAMFGACVVMSAIVMGVHGLFDQDATEAEEGPSGAEGAEGRSPLG